MELVDILPGHWSLGTQLTSAFSQTPFPGADYGDTDSVNLENKFPNAEIGDRPLFLPFIFLKL